MSFSNVQFKCTCCLSEERNHPCSCIWANVHCCHPKRGESFINIDCFVQSSWEKTERVKLTNERSCNLLYLFVCVWQNETLHFDIHVYSKSMKGVWLILNDFFHWLPKKSPSRTLSKSYWLRKGGNWPEHRYSLI